LLRLLVQSERIGEGIGLRRRLPRLLLLRAEEEIEQAFGGNRAGHKGQRARNVAASITRRRTRLFTDILRQSRRGNPHSYG
jgi:hypothetical protein